MEKNLILALDPSTTHIGWVVASPTRYIDGWETKHRGTAEEKLMEIHVLLTKEILSRKISTIIVEEPVYIKRRGKGDAGARTFRVLCELGGVLRLTTVLARKRFITVHPWAVKIALTKNRYAKKEQMIVAAKQQLGITEIGEHHADALSVWLAGKRKL